MKSLTVVCLFQISLLLGFWTFSSCLCSFLRFFLSSFPRFFVSSPPRISGGCFWIALHYFLPRFFLLPVFLHILVFPLGFYMFLPLKPEIRFLIILISFLLLPIPCLPSLPFLLFCCLMLRQFFFGHHLSHSQTAPSIGVLGRLCQHSGLVRLVSSPISGSNWILIFLLCYLKHPNFQDFLASNSETLLVYYPPNNSLLLSRIRLLGIRVCLWTKPLKQVTTLSNVKEKLAKHFILVYLLATKLLHLYHPFFFWATLATLVHQCLILCQSSSVLDQETHMDRVTLHRFAKISKRCAPPVTDEIIYLRGGFVDFFLGGFEKKQTNQLLLAGSLRIKPVCWFR